MDVDEVEELDEHLVDAVLPLLYVLVPEFRHLLSALVETITRRPHHEDQSNELTGELEAVRGPVEPVGEARAVFRGFQYGSWCTARAGPPVSDRGRWHDRDDQLTLNMEAVKERRPEKLGLELGDYEARGDDGVQVGIFLARLAVDGPGGCVRPVEGSLA